MTSSGTVARRQPDKKPAMYVAILGMWLALVVWFSPRLLGLLPYAPSACGKVLVALFILSLDVFWLFGAYYSMLFVFTHLSRRRQTVTLPREPANEPVAILYVTMNDFCYEAALSCVKQRYPNCHVFILDGSTRQDKCGEVDSFRDEFPERVTVVRRKDRSGFKAGALNHALRTAASGFPYFAVIDADGVIPPDFLSTLMPYFQTDGRIGFVHGTHRPNPVQKSFFARDMALGLEPLWTICFGPRNEYGFVPFLGHGAVLRRDVWDQIGGFPAVVSEDLAFSTKACELGYRGHFVPDVVSLEDFPPSYRALRRQQEKYVKGGCEYIHKYLRSFLRSSNVRMVEKLDVLMWLSTLFIPVFHIWFIALFTSLIVLVLGEPRTVTADAGAVHLPLWNAYVLNKSFQIIWRWDFYIVTVVNSLTPLLGTMSLVVTKPWRVVRLLLLSTGLYLSLMIVCAVGVVTYCLTGRAEFLITSDESEDDSMYGSRGRGGGISGWLTGLNASSGGVKCLELAGGAWLAWMCLKTINMGFFAFAFSLVLGYLVLKFGWERRMMRALAPLPFVLILGSLGFLGANVLGVQGVFFLFPGLHF